MEQMKELLTAFEEILDRKLEEKLQPIYERLDRLEERMDRLEERVYKIEVILENEIRPNIQAIAEGHVDINRRIKEVYDMNGKWEMTALKVNYHDALLRRIDSIRKTGHIAEENTYDISE